MAARSLNKVILIGNLTRDPELRYTPSGVAVCTFGVATNRDWTVESGEKKEETEFHRIVAWNKLAELCSQLLFKGRRVYIEGRLQTRQWEDKEGNQRQTTEIVASEMIILDNKRADEDSSDISTYSAEKPAPESDVPEVDIAEESQEKIKKAAEEVTAKSPAKKVKETPKDEVKKTDEKGKEETTSKEVSDDIPF